jgi:hypothetical protein
MPENFLPVVMSMRAASAQAIATHGVVNIAALDAAPTKTSGGGDMRVGASCPKAKVATVDEVAVGEAEMLVHGVQVIPCVPALEAQQACAMRWGVASVEEFCGGALIECVRKGGTCGPDLPGDIIRRHRDERGVRRRSKKLLQANLRILETSAFGQKAGSDIFSNALLQFKSDKQKSEKEALKLYAALPHAFLWRYAGVIQRNLKRHRFIHRTLKVDDSSEVMSSQCCVLNL